MAKLIAESGPVAFQSHDLVVGDTTIGRHPECTIVLKDAGRVSRYHAQIVAQGGRFFIKDMESRNGTFVNNEQISSDLRPLNHGDSIRVCDVSFRFESDAPSTAPTREQAASEQESKRTILIDDDDSDSSTSSTILNQVDITAGPSGLQMSTSPQVRLEALLSISKHLGGTLQLDEVLPQVLNGLFKIFLQADRGFIILKTEEGEIVPRWSSNRDESDEDVGRISRTIVKHVMEAKKAILSVDASRDDRLEPSQSIADLRIRSMMCAPLLDSSGDAMGVLQLDTLDQRKQFRPDDLEVLASVAQQAAAAIDNARLHEAAMRQQEIAHDLELANQVQMSFLPQRAPELDGYEFFSYYQAANFVGGDYYDYIPMPDGRTAVIVADVVGHGIAAAMMMAKLSGEAKYCLARESDAAQAIIMLNDRLSDIQVDRFVTLVMIVIDPAKHEVTIVNAGHMAPIWLKSDGSIDEPGADVSGLPVAIMQGLEYQQTAIQLGAGESLTMYTDGINEAMDGAGKMYGIDRLRTHIQGATSSLSEMGDAIVADVRQFVGKGPQSDDMCMVCVKRH